MSEDRNNPSSIVPDTANISELPQISPTVDPDAAITESSSDIPPGDPTIEEPESTETTDNSSSIPRQQEDSGNSKCLDKPDESAAKIKSPLFTKIIDRLKSDQDISGLLNSLSDFLGTDENELIAEEKKYIERLKEIIDLIQGYQNKVSDLTNQSKQLATENNELNRRPKLDNFPQKNKNYNPNNSQTIPIHRNKELEDELDNVKCQLNNYKQSYQNMKDKFRELEMSQARLLAELASLKHDTGTHYDGTSSRPQHHALIIEYPNLKRKMDVLATSLYNFSKDPNPEIKDPSKRKEKLNNIRAIISENILISGQAIMLLDRTSLIDSVTEQPKPDDPDENSFSQVEEYQTKSLNVESEFKYSTAGEWQERDFQQASTKLRDCFCSILELELDFKVLGSEIQTKIETEIGEVLQFLNRAALADPPPNFKMIEKGDSFDPVWHEAANDYKDAGKIVKTIYPAYLVNNEPKVQAIVLTEP